MKRRDFFQGGLLLGGAALCLPAMAHAASMDALTAIQTRHSVRSFTTEAVTDEQVRILLDAAMCAPSAGGEAPWEFVVIRDKETLAQVGGINKYAGYARKAPLAILTCLNTEKEQHTGMGIQDVCACTQNLLLAAHALGLGAVWTGIYPVPERIAGFQKLLGLPQTVQPVALVVAGYPAQPAAEGTPRYDAARVHQERW